MTFHPSHLSKLALVVGGYLLFPQMSVAGPLSVEDAVKQALRDNPELRALNADVAGATGEVITARTYSNPELSVEPGVIRSADTGSSTRQFHGTFSVTQFFEFPGKRELKIALAQRDVGVSGQGFRVRR